MKTLIFSDVHLDVSEESHGRMARFTTFLRDIDPAQVNRIVVVGDLFDFWFEYRHVVFSGYFDVLRAFADLRGQGVELHLICGNHDLWAGAFLQNDLGFTIHPKQALMDFAGRRVLFCHGDGVNPKDWAYRLYKKVASAGLIIRLFRLLHPDWAMALARFVSRGSRKRFGVEDVSTGPEVKPIRAFAAKLLSAGEADVVVCGHSHHPVIEEIPTPNGTGLFINPGDWLYHESWVEWDGDVFRQSATAAKSDEVAGAEADGSID